MQSKLGKFIVAGRFMRTFYAVIKACAFCGLAALRPLPEVWPSFWSMFGAIWTALTYASVYVAVLLCVLRGLPVIIEFVYAEKQNIARRRNS
jgi:CDP-diacylglycerol--glycerol-3-phosphate 3-phosphatidyltransferase